ncbi:uncharacterized protein JCM15063_001667 [Sporobolomyces koalae]|uniref:uncharacterized protein n=1 Tax=Sporobolomyces koalae TaxID=500713 RepID=UPI00317B51F6
MATELLVTGFVQSRGLHSKLVATLGELCERGEAFSLNEQVYTRGRRTGPVPAGETRIRVRSLRSYHQPTTWSLTVLHKPEPVRTSPLALQYSVSEISVEQGCRPDELVSAFGFERVSLSLTKEFELWKRGTKWERSGVSIVVYQLYPDDLTNEPLDPVTWIVQASIRFAQPGPTPSQPPAGASGNGTGTRSSTPLGSSKPDTISGQEERDRSLAALERIKKALKGVVDLKRLE